MPEFTVTKTKTKAMTILGIYKYYTLEEKCQVNHDLNNICICDYIERFRDVEMQIDFSKFPVINSDGFNEIYGENALENLLA